VVRLAARHAVDAEELGQRYYALGQRVDFAWLLARLDEVGDEDRWQRRAVAGLEEDLWRARGRLALAAPDAIPPRPMEAVHDLVRDLRAAPRVTLAALQVVVRELRRLAENVRGEEPL